jgi:hypothetical protein
VPAAVSRRRNLLRIVSRASWSSARI